MFPLKIILLFFCLKHWFFTFISFMLISISTWYSLFWGKKIFIRNVVDTYIFIAFCYVYIYIINRLRISACLSVCLYACRTAILLAENAFLESKFTFSQNLQVQPFKNKKVINLTLIRTYHNICLSEKHCNSLNVFYFDVNFTWILIDI